MRIGFVDVSQNKLDAFEACSQMCSERVSDVTLERFTAPDLLKIPLAAKRLLDEGADAALVFLTASSQDAHGIDLVHEKVIDVELASGKFVFLAIVYDDEWRSQEQLQTATEERLVAALEALFNSVHSPASLAPSPQAPAPADGAMGMFGGSAPQESEEAGPAQPPETGAGGGSLF